MNFNDVRLVNVCIDYATEPPAFSISDFADEDIASHSKESDFVISPLPKILNDVPILPYPRV